MRAVDEGTPGNDRYANALIAIAAALALLMLLKFVVVKPIMFLLLALLFVVAAVLIRRRVSAGRWLFALLCLVTTVVFGAHLFDKGLDAGAYQNNADYVMILLGFPLAIVGLVVSARGLRGTQAAEG